MTEISKETWKKCDIEVFDDDKYFWINKRDLESNYSNREDIFDKCNLKKQNINLN